MTSNQPANPAVVPEKDAPAFTITREFNAPRPLLFEVWSQAEHLKHWWGPKGCKLTVKSLDFRPGGEFHYRLDFPGDCVMWGKFHYQEIDAPERMVYVNSFSDEAGGLTRHPLSPTWPSQMLNRQLFEMVSSTVTRITLTVTALNATAEELKTFQDGFESMNQGFGGTLDQLAAYLATLGQPVTKL